MRSTRLLALTALLSFLPLPSPAADLPVQYTVREKELKAALSGTNMTFELHSDPACGTPAVYSAVVPIQNVQFITKIKKFTPKNDVKLPNTVAMQHTLPNVTASGNLYLIVMGTGVIPVGGACQAQAAQLAPPSCTDDIQNGGESDEDCGGANFCPRCPNGDSCTVNSDCTSNACVSGTCTPASSCNDMMQSGSETGVDCGGPNMCPRCGTGQGCVVGSDCQSQVCMAGMCQSPSCSDMVKNGSETDVDCGGPMCPGCGLGDTCNSGSDCVSNNCSGGICVP